MEVENEKRIVTLLGGSNDFNHVKEDGPEEAYNLTLKISGQKSNLLIDSVSFTRS